MTKKISRVLLLVLFLFVGLFTFACDGTLLDNSNNPRVIVTGEAVLAVGQSFEAKAKVEPVDKYEQKVTWASSNDEIITINENGIVTGVKDGRATIRATYEDSQYHVVGKYSVKVVSDQDIYTDEVPTSIDVVNVTSVSVDTLKLLRVITVPANACQDVNWSSSNEEIATVDKFGVAKFKKVGTVTITATAKNSTVNDTVVINVLENSRAADLEQANIDCILKAKDSIFGIANYVKSEHDVLEKTSLGSGFVYDCWGYLEDGTKVYDLTTEGIVKYGYYLITNRHVVQDSDALKIYIASVDEEIDAELIQYDDKVDMAVLEFQYDEYIKPLEIADSDLLKAGQFVIAIGNPEGFEYSSSATQGIISYPIRYISSDTDNDNVNDWDAAYIQHDAAINPGNSGGPLLNLFGQVVGINTLKFASNDIDNMGFSIPSKDFMDLLPYLEKGKVPVRARIGVTTIPISSLLATDYENNSEYKYIIPEGCKTGLYITAVSEGSVADGKILADDILIEFNGVAIKNSLQLRAELGAIVVGSNTEILVKVLRNGEVVEVTLVW